MADKEQEPTPHEMYKSSLDTATDNVLKVKKEHDKASVSVYAAIKGKFDKVDPKNHKQVYDLLKDAAIKYKQEVKILNGKPNDEFELGEIIQTMRELHLSPADVIKKFQIGEGKEVIDKLMDHYQSTHIQGKYSVWFHNEVGLDYKKKSKLAEGFKKHHKSTDAVGHITETLENKILQQAVSQAQQ